MDEAVQTFSRHTQDSAITLAVTLVGGPVLAVLAVSGAPPDLLGISLDNTIGRTILIATSILLVTTGLHVARHMLRRDPDILLTDTGIDFYRFPRSRHLAWSDIKAIELTETSFGFGTKVPLMRLHTDSGVRSVSVKVHGHDPKGVVEMTGQRWAEAVGLGDPQQPI